jgi:hypothetical protein
LGHDPRSSTHKQRRVSQAAFSRQSILSTSLIFHHQSRVDAMVELQAPEKKKGGRPSRGTPQSQSPQAVARRARLAEISKKAKDTKRRISVSCYRPKSWMLILKGSMRIST